MLLGILWRIGLIVYFAWMSQVPYLPYLGFPIQVSVTYIMSIETLCSPFHEESEIFLQRMMTLYVASHYKNSPNDLHLMADSPDHHLFVLLGSVGESQNVLPDILCVIQVCLEGQISRNSAFKSLQMGWLSHGDQIPQKFCEIFRDTDFPSFSGARVVRIAVHPSALRDGYGSTALELLTRSYEGNLTMFSDIELDNISTSDGRPIHYARKVSLQEETIVPKQNLPPLLVPICERLPEKIAYIGALFGLTTELFCFWKKLEFLPFYVSRDPNCATGERSCMVLKQLDTHDMDQTVFGRYLSDGFITDSYKRFRNKFIRDIPHFFRDLDYKFISSILYPKISLHCDPESSKSLVDLTDFDQLEAYVNDHIDCKEVFHIATTLAQNFFNGNLVVRLSEIEASILLCIGLQLKDISSLEVLISNFNINYQVSLKLEKSQIMSKFHKLMKKFYEYLKDKLMEEMSAGFPQAREVSMNPHDISVDNDLNDGANEVHKTMEEESVGWHTMENESVGWSITEDESVECQNYSIGNRKGEFEETFQHRRHSSPTGLNTQYGKQETSINSYKRKRKHL